MKFYAVAIGLKGPAVYTNWDQCKADVSGVSNAVYKSFPTRELALEWLDQKKSQSSQPVVKEQLQMKSPELVDNSQLIFYGTSKELKPLREYFRWSKSQGGVIFKIEDITQVLKLIPVRSYHKIYVDGGHNRQTGDEAWACVVDATGKDLIREWTFILTDLTLKRVSLPVGDRTVAVSNFTDVTSQQNNGAELLAMLVALRISQYAQVDVICSDSKLIVDYWSKGHANAVKDVRKKAYICECGNLRKVFSGTIQKIPGAGNPADLGYH